MTLQAPMGQEFVFHDGNKVATLSDLLDALKMIPLTEFSTFVSPDKNDFANWIQYALHEDALAERFRSTADRDTLILKLAERLEEKKAEQNLFTLAQTGTLREPAHAQEQSKKEATAAPKAASISLPLLKQRLMIKELLIGAIFGVFLGFFIGKLIAVWLQG